MRTGVTHALLKRYVMHARYSHITHKLTYIMHKLCIYACIRYAYGEKRYTVGDLRLTDAYTPTSDHARQANVLEIGGYINTRYSVCTCIYWPNQHLQ